MCHIFSKRLIEVRLTNRLSQKELAVTLKVTPATISNYENGIYLPPLSKACILAKELHTSLDYLCGLTNFDFNINLLSQSIFSNVTLYDLIQSVLSLTPLEQQELLNYKDFLTFKRNHQPYLDIPKIYKVAEEHL